MSLDLKDLTKRASHTFVQAFLSVFLLGIPLVVSSAHAQGVGGGKRALIALATAALAAALSALKTMLVQTPTA